METHHNSMNIMFSTGTIIPNPLGPNQIIPSSSPPPPSSISSSSSSSCSSLAPPGSSSRYENQKRRDWNTFSQYLKNHRPPLALSRCSGAHVLEFLRYLDQFGKTKVHTPICPFYGHPNPPAPCPCPLRQAWGSLDALIGRLRAAFEENGGKPEANPFGARAVRLYLREVRDLQSKARGISYEKKKRKRPLQHQQQQQQHIMLPQQAMTFPPPGSSHMGYYESVAFNFKKTEFTLLGSPEVVIVKVDCTCVLIRKVKQG